MNRLDKRYSIKVVENRTGLTHHVIRVWEKRYQAVIPSRSDTNRRLYSDSDIEKLKLLNKATTSGHKIRQIANYSIEELKVLIREDKFYFSTLPERDQTKKDDQPKEVRIEDLLQASLDSIQRVDNTALEAHLSLASVYYSKPVILEKLIVPLLRRIGNLWRDGDFRIAHEHLASAVIRTVLGDLIKGHDLSPTAPNILVTTPIGQLHELGALIVAVTAVSAGWRATYLGPNLPAQEIAGIARQNSTKAVALSIVFPPDDPRIVSELKYLRRFLPDNIKIILGGLAAYSYKKTIQEIEAILLEGMPSLMAVLESIQAETTT